MKEDILYTRYPIVTRALGLAAFRPSARASKGILHTRGHYADSEDTFLFEI